MTNLILPFHPSHMAGLKPLRKEDVDSLGGVDPDQFIRAYYRSGPSYSYFVGHQIIAVIGMIKMWHGVGEVWMLTTDHVNDNISFFHRETLKLMVKTRKELNLHRIQCTVHERNKRAIRWMLKLGFTWEATHKMYGPDKLDHLRFARLWQH